MTNPTQRTDEHGTTVLGRCPAHGDWSRKVDLPLSPEALALAECPTCAGMAPTRAISFEQVPMSGNCDKHGAWEHLVPKFAEDHMRGRCPHCDAEMKQRQDEAERRQHLSSAGRKRQAKLDDLFERAAIPRRFQNRSFDNYRIDAPGSPQDTVHKRAKRYAHRFDKAMTVGASMIFHGKPGTGKNHLAAAIANHVIPNFGASVLFITVYELVQRIRASYNGNGPTEGEILKECGSVDLLILDEVGVQLGTRHEEVVLTDLINRRYADIRPTILLTNLTREMIAQQLGERVIDRMEEGGGGSLAFEWDSYRAKVFEDDGLAHPKYSKPDWLNDEEPA